MLQLFRTNPQFSNLSCQIQTCPTNQDYNLFRPLNWYHRIPSVFVVFINISIANACSLITNYRLGTFIKDVKFVKMKDASRVHTIDYPVCLGGVNKLQELNANRVCCFASSCHWFVSCNHRNDLERVTFSIKVLQYICLECTSRHLYYTQEMVLVLPWLTM